MNIMKQGITFFILFAAVAAYLAGSTLESMILLMIGAVLESIFWFRLLQRNESASKLKD
jgi:membrane protein implicated in regulation of membrane protease activity